VIDFNGVEPTVRQTTPNLGGDHRHEFAEFAMEGIGFGSHARVLMADDRSPRCRTWTASFRRCSTAPTGVTF